MPGEQGRREFQAEIKRLFQIPDDVQFEVGALLHTAAATALCNLPVQGAHGGGLGTAGRHDLI
eukprot:1138171-Pelagomonas_calceolata.AAC.2